MSDITRNDVGLVCGYGNIKGARICQKIDGKYQVKESYNVWIEMLIVCYSKALHNVMPECKECTVSEEWLSYKNFERWYDLNHVDGYKLDIESIYSKESCKFVK